MLQSASLALFFCGQDLLSTYIYIVLTSWRVQVTTWSHCPKWFARCGFLFLPIRLYLNPMLSLFAWFLLTLYHMYYMRHIADIRANFEHLAVETVAMDVYLKFGSVSPPNGQMPAFDRFINLKHCVQFHYEPFHNDPEFIAYEALFAQRNALGA